MTAQTRGHALLRSPDIPGWLCFQSPVAWYETAQLHQVGWLLGEVERRVEEEGLYAVGFLSYEAAPAFDEAFRTAAPGELPLVGFGLYEAPQRLPSLPPSVGPWPFSPTSWRASLDTESYLEAIGRIKRHIQRGDSYQVNFTYQLSAPFFGDPLALFGKLMESQPTAYAAYLDVGRFALCSASPELFFRLDGDLLEARPMKGTRPRGPSSSDDQSQAKALYESPKDRAENAMIVDMMRNDISRIAEPASVEVTELFAIEKYPTVWQMTSHIQAQSSASVAEIFGALFPCASITGAPKVRTMELIAELEPLPRQSYTGAIGWIFPRRRAQFNVAIRTLQIDKQEAEARLGIGGGIVWDSEPEFEHKESLTKAQFSLVPRPRFALLESLLWEPEGGYFLLHEHLQRLEASARYFDYPFPTEAIVAALEREAEAFHAKPHKLRLQVAASGALSLEAEPLAPEALGATTPQAAPTVSYALASSPISSQDPFLYHKTTHRQVYREQRAQHPDATELLLWNEDGLLTETCTSNLVVLWQSKWLTPHSRCGLLPGTYRRHLLEAGALEEAELHRDILDQVDGLYAINSVRRWRKLSRLG